MAQPAAAPLKLIFLDIDGVICCNMYGRLEEPKLELLKSVCQRTGAKVVLSTDWRRVPQLKVQLISTLKAYGIATIGATPCRPNWLAVRPEEIVAWIKGYASAPNAKVRARRSRGAGSPRTRRLARTLAGIWEGGSLG
jgi:hypothetical protein